MHGKSRSLEMTQSESRVGCVGEICTIREEREEEAFLLSRDMKFCAHMVEYTGSIK